MSALNSDVVRLESPDFYIEDRETVYPRLHAEAPVFRYEPLDIFVLSKQEDIRHAARETEIFSSSRGLHLHELRLDPAEKAVYATIYHKDGEQFAYADPPRHRELRGIASRSFAPRSLARLTARMQEHTARLLDSIEPGEPVDFLSAVAAVLPIQVAQDFIGLPEGNEPQVLRWSNALESLKLVHGPDNLRAAVAELGTMNDYFREQIAYKREHPGEDLISSLLEAELDGAPLSEANLLIYCGTFLAAGSDTTRSLLSGMLHALIQHPAQWELLRADRSLVEAAVEESLRWTTPARGFMRTAVQDTQIRDVEIKEGQRVYLLFDAGNRDAEVIPDPWTYDITRPLPIPHMAFGYGIHQCIAGNLARLEARILLSALLDRFERVELAGEPREIRQLLRAGWHDMPVVFDPSAR
ncbi:cytochrome P450 [Arthrobacter sp. NPDC058127]|uniref:cytochrome P450 n=1 Tax=Arthrobacter sp. NPDC058127 TaxID=3346351 RepID=UPI0036E0187B